MLPTTVSIMNILDYLFTKIKNQHLNLLYMIIKEKRRYDFNGKISWQIIIMSRNFNNNDNNFEVFIYHFDHMVVCDPF